MVGCGETGSYVASDIIAMIDATRDVVVLADGQMARLRPDGIEYYDEAGNPLSPTSPMSIGISTSPKRAGDFMLKEIHEQPRVIRDTLAGHPVAGSLVIDELDMTPAELNLVDRVYIIACGTSYHAGLIAKNLIESWAHPARWRRSPASSATAIPSSRPRRRSWPYRNRARRPIRWRPSATLA